MPLPPDGTISLLGYSRPGETSQSRPKQAMIIRMSEKTLDLLESFPQLQFEFSENPGITIGDSFFSVTSVPETTPHDLYLRTSLAGKKNAPLKLYANITGKFTVERQLDDRITDKVRAITVDAQKERAGRAAIFLDAAADLPPTNGKKSRKEGNTTSMFRKPVRPTDQPRRPTPSVPAATLPSRVSPAPPALPQRSKEALQALRKRIVWCIAISERTSEQVVKLVGGSKNCSDAIKRDILELLEEIAEPVPLPNNSKVPKMYRLKTKSWLEVRPYEMTGVTESERTTLARSAKRALRDLGISESDPAWGHVQYRNQNAGQTSDNPKRGITSATAKEKKAAKPRDTGEIMMKNESIKASSSRPPTNNTTRDDDASRSLPPKPTTAARPRPGSGFKAKQPTPFESRDFTSGRSPATHGKAVPGEPPNGVQDKDVHRSQGTTSHSTERRPGTTSAPKIGKLRKEDVAASDSERSDRVRERERGFKSNERGREDRERDRRERERERESQWEKEREKERRTLEKQRERDRARRREAELESDREHERARKKVRERGRSQEREDGERSDDSLRPPKRKKISREDDEYGTSSPRTAPKKRKMESPPPRGTKLRDPGLPKKPEPDSHLRPKAIKREPSPLPRIKEYSPLHHTKIKEPSPLPPLPRIKKEPTPIPKLPAPPAKPSPSVSSSQASSSKPKITARRRRGSDIYTSSEDEGEIRTSIKHETPQTSIPPTTASHRDEITSQPRPRTSKLPPADDHAALRSHYDSSYLPYLGNFQSLMKQKEVVRAMLRKIEKGSSGSVTESDGDGDLLDVDELKRLVSEYHNQHDDLEHIQRIFSKKD